MDSYQEETSVRVGDKVRVWTQGNVYVGTVESVEFTTKRVEGNSRLVYQYELDLYCLGIGHLRWSQRDHGGRFELVSKYMEWYENQLKTKGGE